MKKLGLLILGLSMVLFAGNFTQAKDYEYTNLDITADVLIDGTINVKEDFTANFFVDKHGIIRDIPLNYSVGGKDFHIDVSNIYVQGKNFTTSKNNGNIEIKIGDANRTIIGEQSYPISYTAYGLIRNFSGRGYAELYWNLVGYDFDTNINKIKAELILPLTYTGFTKDDFLITTDGKGKTIDGFAGTVDRSKGDRIIITYDKGLPAFQGITLAIKFPSDYFEFDHNRQASLVGIAESNKINKTNNVDNMIVWGLIAYYILAITIIILFNIRKKTKKAKDGISSEFGEMISSKEIEEYISKKQKYRKGNPAFKRRIVNGKLRGKFAKKYPVIVQYNPPIGIDSAEAGLLLNRGTNIFSLLSLIYKRAAEGLIKIDSKITLLPNHERRFGTNLTDIITLSKINDIDGNANEYERIFFNSLFKKHDCFTIDNHNHINIKNHIMKKYKDYGEEMGRFKTNKDNKFLHNVLYKHVLKQRIFLAFLLYGLISAIMMSRYTNTIIFFSIIWGLLLSFVIIAIILDQRYSLTDKGAQLVSHLLGYKKFIHKCDENQLRLCLIEDPLFLDKVLPYAVAFGLDTELLSKMLPIMSDMNIKPPIWYTSDIGDLNCITDSIYDSIPSHSHYDSGSGFDSGSSFSSGGSSFSDGGGGGGGGGRSW